MSSADLFDRNLQLFEQHFPELHQRIRAMAPPMSRLVREGEAAVDINLRSGLLYKRDGRALAQEQVDGFAASPCRLNYAVPMRSCFDSNVSRQVFDGMMRTMRKHDIGTLALMPCVESGYLVILGIGLGYHIPLLLDLVPSTQVIIVEPFEEFLFHSLHVTDWSAIIDRCEREGRTLHLHCAPHADGMTDFVGGVLDTHNPTLLDGTYIFTHYPLWELTETKRRLINEMPRRMVAMGYFEDERKMMCNTATNLHRLDFRLFEGKIIQRYDIPVFLIGSGPSIDQSIDIIRQWRDHAIVVSSGSSLPLLLRQGIIPDFHTELENGPEQYDKTKHVLDSFPELFPDGRLTGIRLIGSATMNPRVPPLFDEVFFFFREAVTSTTTFGRDRVPLRGAAPTCANTSLVAAACLGLGDVYLFGYDCGWRDGKDHHAKDTIYYNTERFKTEEMKGCYTLPGNFGGDVQSDLLFDWSRNILQQCIRAYRLRRVFNCSDGALIEGTVPKVPEALDFATLVDRDAVVRRVRESCETFAAGTFFKDTDLAPVRAELRAYVDALTAIIDRSLADVPDFPAFVEEAWQMIRKTAATRLASGLVYFSTVGELKQAALFISRVPNSEDRRKVTRDFLTEFRALHQDLLAQSLVIIDDMEGLFTGSVVPEWTKNGPPV